MRQMSNDNPASLVDEKTIVSIGAVLMEQIKHFHGLADIHLGSSLMDPVEPYAHTVREGLLASAIDAVSQLKWFVEHQDYADKGEIELSPSLMPMSRRALAFPYRHEPHLRPAHPLTCRAFFARLSFVLGSLRHGHLKSLRDKTTNEASGVCYQATPLSQTLKHIEARVVYALFCQSLRQWIDEQVSQAKSAITLNDFSQVVLTLTRMSSMTVPFKPYLEEAFLARYFGEIDAYFEQHILSLNGAHAKGKRLALKAEHPPRPARKGPFDAME